MRISSGRTFAASARRAAPETYDLVLGNAPWGKDSETEHARHWAKNPAHEWPIPNKAVGTLFLVKSATLAKRDGRVSMIQPASSLLFNRSGPAKRFRERLFSAFKVEQIVNLSTLRFELFENATSPPCIVTLRPTEPDDEAPCLYLAETDQACRRCRGNRQPIYDCHRAP